MHTFAKSSPSPGLKQQRSPLENCVCSKLTVSGVDLDKEGQLSFAYEGLADVRLQRLVKI